MALDGGIDTTHYVILEAVTEPMWKSRIHGIMEDITHEQPIDMVPSVQTINRRVDDLCEAGYLSSCILSPDEVDRDLIIGYKRTAKGDDAIQVKRGQLLEEVAHTPSNAACAMDREVTRETLNKLVADEFELNEAATKRIKEEFGESEILSLLALHYAQLNADEFATHDRDPGDGADNNNNKSKNFQRLVE